MVFPQQVLVTGSAGVIGRIVCGALSECGHRVRGFDRVASPGVESVVGTITDAEAVDRAVAGCSTVVHLAATTDDADFLSELVPNNIVGVYHVLEAARRLGVKRVVLASTMQTVSGLRATPDRPVRVSDGAAPANGYAVTKVFAENLGHMFALRHGMSVIAARIGWLPRTAKALQRMRDCGSSHPEYLSHRDAARFFVAAVEAPASGYHLVFVTSKPQAGVYGLDPEPARTAVGYEAADMFPDGCAFG